MQPVVYGAVLHNSETKRYVKTSVSRALTGELSVGIITASRRVGSTPTIQPYTTKH